MKITSDINFTLSQFYLYFLLRYSLFLVPIAMWKYILLFNSAFFIQPSFLTSLFIDRYSSVPFCLQYSAFLSALLTQWSIFVYSFLHSLFVDRYLCWAPVEVFIFSFQPSIVSVLFWLHYSLIDIRLFLLHSLFGDRYSSVPFWLHYSLIDIQYSFQPSEFK